MTDFQSKISTLYSLEQLSAGQTEIHKIEPLAKILVTFCYLICVLSMNTYDVFGLVPFLFYPLIMMGLLDIPYGMLMKRAMIALPFVFFAGISNLIFDKTLYEIGAFVITGGIIRVITLLFRTFLSVMSILILVASTPFRELTACLKRIKVPVIFVMLLEMTYRYLSVLANEASTMVIAYRMRGNGRKWPKITEFGPFVGQLLLRSVERARRVYHAMCCRLYDNPKGNAGLSKRKLHGKSVLFLFIGCGTSICFRYVDVVTIIGRFFYKF